MGILEKDPEKPYVIWIVGTKTMRVTKRTVKFKVFNFMLFFS